VGQGHRARHNLGREPTIAFALVEAVVALVVKLAAASHRTRSVRSSVTAVVLVVIRRSRVSQV
jgi:hypothetical protein